MRLRRKRNALFGSVTRHSAGSSGSAEIAKPRSRHIANMVLFYRSTCPPYRAQAEPVRVLAR
jgi:hypothetical protein